MESHRKLFHCAPVRCPFVGGSLARRPGMDPRGSHRGSGARAPDTRHPGYSARRRLGARPLRLVATVAYLDVATLGCNEYLVEQPGDPLRLCRSVATVGATRIQLTGRAGAGMGVWRRTHRMAAMGCMARRTRTAANTAR